MTKGIRKAGLTLAFLGFAALLPLSAQTVIGGQTAGPTALLDLQSTSKGLLLPRLTTTQRNAIANPQSGLVIYNTTLNCLDYNAGTSATPRWICLAFVDVGTIGALSCGSPSVSGTIKANQAITTASASVSYTGGNGGQHNGQKVNSTGVTGLKATLTAGFFANGSGTLSYAITGTPSGSGTASFALNIGGKTCTLAVSVTN